jgi:prophage regulatory protein
MTDGPHLLQEGVMNPAVNVPERVVRSDRLLNKWAVEERTSLDITTIYRKMKAGTFPQPVRVGRRRVAWRESDIAAWQAGLEVGTRL